MNLKKLLCLLLALAMVLSLAACTSDDYDDDDDDDDDDEKVSDKKDKDDKDRDDDDDEEVEVEEDPLLSELIVGTWAFELHFDSDTNSDMAELAEMGLEMQFDLPILITFTEDGDFFMSIDEDKADQATEQINAAFTQAMMDYLELSAAAEGIDMDILEAAYESETGMTIRAYAESVAEETDLFGNLAERLDEDGSYNVDDEEMILYLEGEAVTVQIKGDTLTLVTPEDETAWDRVGFTFPIKMERCD